MQGKTGAPAQAGDERDEEPLGLFVGLETLERPSLDVRPAAVPIGGSAIPETPAVVSNAGSALVESPAPRRYSTRGSAIPEHYQPLTPRDEFQRDKAPTPEVSVVELPRRRDRALGGGRPGHGASRRSSARSGDSGSDDSDSSEGSEPPPRRLCAFCGKDIPADRSPKATYCTDKHADRDRQRRKRARDRERSKLPPTPQPADFWRMYELTDRDRKRLWELAVCRCNGHHVELEPGWCCKCGHPLPHKLKDGAERYAAFVTRQERLAAVRRLAALHRQQHYLAALKGGRA
jgi:hypothetical protein